jgi:hypothetical protein
LELYWLAMNKMYNRDIFGQFTPSIRVELFSRWI